MLEDEADAALLRRRRAVTSSPSMHDGARVGHLEAGDDAQQRRLARAATGRAARSASRRRRRARRRRAPAKSPKRLVTFADGDHASLLPWLDAAVIAQQRRERDDREQRRGRVGARRGRSCWKRFSTSSVSVSVSPAILPETTLTAPNSPMRARDREHDAVGDAPADRRQRDAPERLPARRAERRGGLLLLVADLAQHRRRPRARRTAA